MLYHPSSTCRVKREDSTGRRLVAEKKGKKGKITKDWEKKEGDVNNLGESTGRKRKRASGQRSVQKIKSKDFSEGVSVQRGTAKLCKKIRRKTPARLLLNLGGT